VPLVVSDDLRHHLPFAQRDQFVKSESDALVAPQLASRPPGALGFRPGLLHALWTRALAAQSAVAVHGAAKPAEGRSFTLSRVNVQACKLQLRAVREGARLPTRLQR